MLDIRCSISSIKILCLRNQYPTSKITHQTSRKDPDMLGGGVIVTEPIPNQAKVPAAAAADDALKQIRDSLRGLRFGSVNIIVQDGVVIQIDRAEKRRLRGTRNNP